MVQNDAFHLESDGWYSFRDNRKINFGTVTPPTRVFGDPGAGNMYFGATADNLASRQTFCGQRLGMVRRYNNSSSTSTTDSITQATSDISTGRVPWISYKLQGLTGQGSTSGWAQFASGAGDTWFNGLLSSLNAIGGGPIIITLHHEPQGDGTATDYLAMYNHAMSLKGSSFPQILLATCSLGNYFDVTTSGVKFSDWMTSASCDLFGFDSYNHISYNPANGKANLTVAQVLGLQAAQLKAIDPNKPWVVGEWGNRTNPASPGQASTQMLALYDYARQNGCMGMTWFDSSANVNDGGSPWTLSYAGDGTDGSERLGEFKTILLKTTSKLIPTGGL